MSNLPDFIFAFKKNNAAPCPSLPEAEQLWQAGIAYRQQHFGFLDNRGVDIKDEYIFHTTGIGKTAAKIAAQIGLNSEKAQVMGLLHDFGKYQDEFRGGRFHGLVGYEAMRHLGFDEVAKTCLTHSFPKQDFDIKNYRFPEADMLVAKEILNNMVYDDYDYLIQFCDLLFEGLNMVGINARVAGIMRRYNLPFEKVQTLYKNGTALKQYFDAKLGKDIYDFLGIKDEDTLVGRSQTIS